MSTPRERKRNRWILKNCQAGVRRTQNFREASWRWGSVRPAIPTRTRKNCAAPPIRIPRPRTRPTEAPGKIQKFRDKPIQPATKIQRLRSRRRLPMARTKTKKPNQSRPTKEHQKKKKLLQANLTVTADARLRRTFFRSEERRVGKECRSRRSAKQ